MSTPSVSLTITTRPELNTEQGWSPYIISAIQVVPTEDGAWLVSTDGRGIAISKASGECAIPAYMPGRAIVDSSRPVKVDFSGEWRTSDGRFTDKVEEGRYPRWPAIFEGIDLDNRIPITFDGRRLFRLMRAMAGKRGGGVESVTLFIDPADREASLPVIAGQGFGVLMPICRESDDGSTERSLLRSRIDAAISDYAKAFPEAAPAAKVTEVRQAKHAPKRKPLKSRARGAKR